MNGERIYLDHAATTPCRPEAIEAMLPHLRDAANAGSSHADGRRARNAVDDARARVGAALGVQPREIVFTSGGSEADSLALAGVARAARARGRHIVTLATEHHAVLHATEALRDDGWEVTVLGVDGEGLIGIDAFVSALRPDTVLASIMLANNEIGTIAPVAALSRAARERGVLFHTDAVQAPGRVALDAGELGVDLMSLSAHKFYGPKGVGLLFVRTGTPLAPIVLGGGQEAGMRAGTENVAGIIGLATALELAVAELAQSAPRIAALRDAFEAGARARIPDVVVHGAAAPRLPNIANLGFPGADGAALLVSLDLAGVSASAGSACTSGSQQPSHVLAALGQGATTAAVRFSLGRSTTSAQIESVLDLLPGIVASAREAPAFVGTS